MTKWQTIKNHDGTGLDPVEFIEIGAYRELEAERDALRQDFKRNSIAAGEYSLEAQRLRAENSRIADLYDKEKSRCQRAEVENARLREKLRCSKLLAEVKQLRAALEQITSTKDIDGFPGIKEQIAREALASTKKSQE